MEFIVDRQNQRLDKFLADKAKKFSRSQWEKIIQGKAVKVNGYLIIKPGFKLKKNDRVAALEEKILEKEIIIEPEPDIPIKIVYEDKDILVVDKPAGLLVHPTLKQSCHTLINALVARYPKIVNVGENSLRPGIVHRLDKDTSGLLIVAKNQNAFLFVKEQFLNRRVEKKYLALVEGRPKEKKGIIEYAIKPSKYYRLKKVAVKNIELAKKSMRSAKTDYKVIKIFSDKYALLEVAPLTGRTHQIRVHLAAIGHPIVGDALYGSKSKILSRQFLHAFYLKFISPSGAPLILETGLPKDLKKTLEKLK